MPPPAPPPCGGRAAEPVANRDDAPAPVPEHVFDQRLIW